MYIIAFFLKISSVTPNSYHLQVKNHTNVLHVVFNLRYNTSMTEINTTIKEQLEARELTMLSPYATKSKYTKGRKRPLETPYPIRTEFQRDRDRILHSKSFRRLKHKTQVFLSPFNDHFRTRLTHTLEVAQIARTISRALNLNEDLTEAISLGHDLGHTPFGHCGEKVLNSLVKGGFDHNIQSVRVVELLEDMNLCRETVEGILTHSWGLSPRTPEAQVVQFADKIAYINHDIEDSVRASIISEEDLPKDCIEYFSSNRSKRLGKMIMDVISSSYDKPQVTMSEEGWHYVTKLRTWMFDNIYIDSPAKAEESKASKIIEELWKYYNNLAKEYCSDKNTERIVVDYISGMTDQYAIERFKDIFIPKPLFNPVHDDAFIKMIKNSCEEK